MARMHSPAVLCAALSLLVSCSEEPQDGVDAALQALPTWEEFSPPLPDQEPMAVGDPVFFVETAPLTVIGDPDEDGDVLTETFDDVTYECTSTPYSMTETPDAIVMYSPDVEVLWPGALIQGKSHRDGGGVGSLLPLPIADRSAIEVSVPGVPSGTNFRTVDAPTQAAVAGAIGGIIGDATQADLSTPSTIAFEKTAYHAESAFALSIGTSARYLGFEVNANGEVAQTEARTTVVAHFSERMFEVVVAPPTTPGAFFGSQFTEADLHEQEDLGRIGFDNLPIYVSNVVYGRMLTFSVTSSASEERILAALDASYDSLAGGGGVELSAADEAVLHEAEFAVSSLGGDANGVIALIRSGDLSEYFAEDVPLSSATPLSYTFRNLGDGSIAGVSETAEYTLTECDGIAPEPPPEDATHALVLDKIELVNDACESDQNGPDVELYYSFEYTDPTGTHIIAERPIDSVVHIQEGNFHELETNHTAFDGTEDPAFSFRGFAWDYNTSGSRLVSEWELGFSSSSSVGKQIFFTRPVDPEPGECQFRLYMTWLDLDAAE